MRYVSFDTELVAGEILILSCQQFTLFITQPKDNIMKTLKCSDVGFDCPGVITANTTEEILNQAAKHALEVHGVQVTPAQAAQISTLIKEE